MAANPRTSNIISIVCGLWFLLTSWFWAYGANFFISFPIGLLGLYFWNKARKIDPQDKLGRVSLVIHALGVLISLGVLVALLLYN